MTLRILLVVGLLGLAACDPIKGTVEIYKAIKFKSEIAQVGSCGSGEMPPCENTVEYKTFQPGSYKFALSALSRREATLEVKDGRTTAIVRLNLPEGKELSLNGTTVFSANEIEQEFNLKLDAATDITQSETYRDIESCSETEYITVCRPRSDGRGEECFQEARTRYGSQEVEYYYEYTTTDLKGTMRSRNNSVLLAQLEGRRVLTDKNYVYKGYCF